MADANKPLQAKAESNNIPPPNLDLPLPDSPEIITDNLLRILQLCKEDRTRFIFLNMIKHIHQFINETSITTDEWLATIDFLTRTGQICTPIRQEFILLSDVLGISALVDALNNPPAGGGTESSVLGPFFTEDAPDVELGDTIASDGKGEYMWVEGRVLSTEGKPIPGAVIETWETDEFGYYDTQYAGRDKPDCRGRLRSDKDGYFGYRAVVPVPYPIPGDGPVGQLLVKLNRHNMRPNHLHLMIEAPGFQKLTTALYPENDTYLSTDVVFGVKKSLVVSLKDVDDDPQARKYGFPKGSKFKYLKYDIIMVEEEKSKAAREQWAKEHGASVSVKDFATRM